MPDARYGDARPHHPHSVSVSAPLDLRHQRDRRKPAADSRPMTLITRPVVHLAIAADETALVEAATSFR